MRARPVRVILLTFLALVLLAVAWTGYQAWRVNQELRAAISDAAALQAALEAGDQAGAQQALDSLDSHTQDASDRTNGVAWRTLTHVPAVGDDATGVRVAVDVVHDLSTDALEPLVAEAADLESLLPKQGRIPVGRLAALRDPVSQAQVAFSVASDRLEGEDSGSFMEPLQSKYDELATRVRSTATGLEAADVALQVMPGMLGKDGERNFLLVSQNNAEVRASGGLPGAVSLLRTDDGRLALTRQTTGAEFGMTEQPVLPLTPSELEIYGPQLGTFFLDANFTPDFPRSSALMKARWEQEYADRIDGVFAVDPVALSYVLAGTGPVTVGEVELTADNVVDELLHNVYLRYENPLDQDEFFRQAAQAVFSQLTSGAGDPQEILRGLARGASEHRLLVHSFDAEEQASLSGRTVAGELVTEPTAQPQVGVYLNDTTAAKMSYFLRNTVEVRAESCQAGVQTLAGSATLQSVAPPDAGATLPDYVTGGGVSGIPPGTQVVTLRLYGPVSGTIDAVTLDGKPLEDVEVIDHDGRPVGTTYLFLDPQQTLDLGWTMTTGPDQPGDPVVSVTPGIEPVNASSVAPSAC